MQRQYLFLSDYDIKTEQDLSKVQEHLKAKIKTINKAKKVLVNENEKYRDIFESVNTIKKEKQAATFYKFGDKTFHKQNEKIVDARNILKKNEITFNEAEKLENHYQSLIDECERQIKKMKKELRTSYGLMKDIQYRKEQEIKRQRVQEENKEKKKDNI